MRTVLVLAIAAAALAPSGCRTSKRAEGLERPAEYATDLRMEARDYRVIWTRGGKLGFLQTFAVSEPRGPTVTMHHVLDTEFRQVGWIANDGQGERFVYPAERIGEAKRTTFERVVLPVDTLENQVRRILGVDPTTEIALAPAADQDLHRQ
jgi:hypothetical protein